MCLVCLSTMKTEYQKFTGLSLAFMIA